MVSFSNSVKRTNRLARVLHFSRCFIRRIVHVLNRCRRAGRHRIHRLPSCKRGLFSGRPIWVQRRRSRFRNVHMGQCHNLENHHQRHTKDIFSVVRKQYQRKCSALYRLVRRTISHGSKEKVQNNRWRSRNGNRSARIEASNDDVIQLEHRSEEHGFRSGLGSRTYQTGSRHQHRRTSVVRVNRTHFWKLFSLLKTRRSLFCQCYLEFLSTYDSVEQAGKDRGELSGPITVVPKGLLLQPLTYCTPTEQSTCALSLISKTRRTGLKSKSRGVFFEQLLLGYTNGWKRHIVYNRHNVRRTVDDRLCSRFRRNRVFYVHARETTRAPRSSEDSTRSKETLERLE